MIVGTAGHIDHGKTALVRALTGVDTDRLPEEKARGISIDLGFAYRSTSGGVSTGYVDVPGHERFVHNMLAGATGIDLVLLVVAADDGPMPQTREHLAIVDLLGIRRGIVVLTKIDLVDSYRREAAGEEIRAMLAGTRFAGAEIFPVSVPDGGGLRALSARLESEAVAMDRRNADGRFRLAVDRAFTLAGAGLIVTGTVIAGCVTVGDEVVVSPAGAPARVRKIHAHDAPSQSGFAGQRCAINIAGPRIGVEALSRGDWLIAPSLHHPTDRFDARLRLLAGEARSLRHWTAVHLHIGAAHLMARVALLRETPLEPGGKSFVQIVGERPIAALAGDRFVLRDQSAQRTIGGGIVIDPWPPNRGRRHPRRLALLAALDRENAADALNAALQIEPGWLDLKAFAEARNLSADQARAAAAPSPIILEAPQCSFVLNPDRWAQLRRALLDAVANHHIASPASPGIEASRLRLMLSERLPLMLFDALITALRGRREVDADGPWLKLPGHVPRLTPSDEHVWLKVAPMLHRAGFAPPSVRDIAMELKLREQAVRALLKRQAQMRRVVEIAQDYFYPREVVAHLAELAMQLAAQHGLGIVDTAAYRDRIGTGRKTAIQILEHFDKVGFTHRKGEVRTVRADKIQYFGFGNESG